VRVDWSAARRRASRLSTARLRNGGRKAGVGKRGKREGCGRGNES
jgi:hypothetical protein